MNSPRPEQVEAEVNEAIALVEQQIAEVNTWLYELWVEYWVELDTLDDSGLVGYSSGDGDSDTDFKCVACCTRAAAIEYGDLCSTCFSDCN